MDEALFSTNKKRRSDCRHLRGTSEAPAIAVDLANTMAVAQKSRKWKSELPIGATERQRQEAKIIAEEADEA